MGLVAKNRITYKTSRVKMAPKITKGFPGLPLAMFDRIRQFLVEGSIENAEDVLIDYMFSADAEQALNQFSSNPYTKGSIDFLGCIASVSFMEQGTAAMYPKSGNLYIGIDFYLKYILYPEDLFFILFHERDHYLISLLLRYDYDIHNFATKYHTALNLFEDSFINAWVRFFIPSALPERFYLDPNNLNRIVTYDPIFWDKLIHSTLNKKQGISYSDRNKIEKTKDIWQQMFSQRHSFLGGLSARSQYQYNKFILGCIAMYTAWQQDSQNQKNMSDAFNYGANNNDEISDSKEQSEQKQQKEDETNEDNDDSTSEDTSSEGQGTNEDSPITEEGKGSDSESSSGNSEQSNGTEQSSSDEKSSDTSTEPQNVAIGKLPGPPGEEDTSSKDSEVGKNGKLLRKHPFPISNEAFSIPPEILATVRYLPDLESVKESQTRAGLIWPEIIKDIRQQGNEDVYSLQTHPPTTLCRSDVFLLSQGFLPSYYKSKTSDIKQDDLVVYVDVSGSMEDYIAEVVQAASQLFEKVKKVYWFSTDLYEYDGRESFYYSSGGTDYNKVAEDILKNHKKDNVLVISDSTDQISEDLFEKLCRQFKNKKLYYMGVYGGSSIFGLFNSLNHSEHNINKFSFEFASAFRIYRLAGKTPKNIKQLSAYKEVSK